MMRKIVPDKRSRGGDSLLPDMDRFPRFNIETKHLLEAKDWKIGEEYTVTLKLKMTGLSVHERDNGTEFGNADFEIRGINPHETKRKMNILDNDKI